MADTATLQFAQGYSMTKLRDGHGLRPDRVLIWDSDDNGPGMI